LGPGCFNEHVVFRRSLLNRRTECRWGDLLVGPGMPEYNSSCYDSSCYDMVKLKVVTGDRQVVTGEGDDAKGIRVKLQ
jgi:hypothetical protein